MAIDSTLFAADIPAGTYAKGDMIPLSVHTGPSVVRSGRGAALLKRLTVGTVGNPSGSLSYWKVCVKNSDWIDEMQSLVSSIREPTSLDERSGNVQRGNDCPLTPNSSWEVYAVCMAASTTTVANSMFAIIDVDYPSVSSITDPDSLPGIPTTIEYEVPNAITLNALGAMSSATWDAVNVDIFKAGYEYALQKIEIIGSTGEEGFIALANAAGMGGLQRIMPISANSQNIRNKVEYATKLQKGPMDIRYLMFTNTASPSTDTPNLMMDFVKRKL